MKFGLRPFAAIALAATLFHSGCGGSAAPEQAAGPVDRSYRLGAFMTGYIGQGGEIDRQKNPVLHAHAGETVEIIMINGERMVHDVALRRHRARSEIIVEKGAITRIVFVAQFNDTYYCTIPGHLEAGMAGEFVIIEESQEIAAGIED